MCTQATSETIPRRGGGSEAQLQLPGRETLSGPPCVMPLPLVQLALARRMLMKAAGGAPFLLGVSHGCDEGTGLRGSTRGAPGQWAPPPSIPQKPPTGREGRENENSKPSPGQPGPGAPTPGEGRERQTGHEHQKGVFKYTGLNLGYKDQPILISRCGKL